MILKYKKIKSRGDESPLKIPFFPGLCHIGRLWVTGRASCK
jgi:hypothetical protein